MTHLDLFSGIGGFHLAAGWAGFETVGFSEIEPYCCKLLVEKWPEIRNYGDIRTADFSGLRGRVTVLSAGVPCQPASLAGKRRGADDDRWLWEATLDVVGSVQPAWIIFENPPGILTLDEFGGILLRLGSLGYQVRAFSVPANALGAKHRRQRVFIVAHACHDRRDAASFAGGPGQGTLMEASDGRSQWSASAEQPAGSGCGQGGTEVVAHAERERCDGRRTGWGEEIGRGACAATIRSGTESEALADADRAGLEEHESREQGQLAAVVGSSGPLRFRLTEPPLCRRIDGISDRSHRLKTLGNAVVPQQAYPFFAAIAQAERE